MKSDIKLKFKSTSVDMKTYNDIGQLLEAKNKRNKKRLFAKLNIS